MLRLHQISNPLADVRSTTSLTDSSQATESTIRSSVSIAASGIRKPKVRASTRKPKLQVPSHFTERGNTECGYSYTRRFKVGLFLGRGGFAEVYLLEDLETGLSYAGKVIPMKSLRKKKHHEKFKMEVKIHQSLDHQHIVKFISVFEDQQFMVIVLELCTNQSMMELIRNRKTLTEFETRYYMMQLLDGIRHLHDNRVIHRDLKLGNIFLDSKMCVKLGDFGLATQLSFDDERRKTICGTPNYIAPEILAGKDGHSYEVDTWSLGVILYTLLVGRPPFETSDVKTTYRRIKESSYYFPDRCRISDDARDLIRRMLQKNPDQRPTLEEVAQHHFMSGHQIPTTLPTSSLVMPPTLQMSRKVQSAPQITRKNTENYPPNVHMGAPRTLKPVVTAQPLSPRRALRQVGGANARKKRPENILNVIFTTLREALAQGYMYSGPMRPSPMAPPPAVWIQRWGDYSSKYGLAYEFNSGVFGAYFNDGCSMLRHQDGVSMEHIERLKGQDASEKFTVDLVPAQLKKKVNLLTYFTRYLPTKEEFFGPQCDATSLSRAAAAGVVYVKKWLKTPEALFFRLSNGTLQVYFKDGTGILLADKGQIVTFVKKGTMKTFWIEQALSYIDAKSIRSRLEYILDRIRRLLKRRDGK